MMSATALHDASGFAASLGNVERAMQAAPLRPVIGRVTRVSGTMVEASLNGARLGEVCMLGRRIGSDSARYGEVVGFKDGVALLSMLGEMDGLASQTPVTPTGAPLRAPVGHGLLGRIIDGLGRPLDRAARGDLFVEGWRNVDSAPPDPLSRAPINQPMPLGIPSIDALMTTGEGQRVGLFGQPGVGKSTLMSAIAKASSADVAVIAMVGERGREVSEFVEDALGPDGLARSVVIAATSDRSAMERLKAPFLATSIAEHFRDQGLKVVLLMDSLTRLARAQREIGLAAGEPPARRAFPPSVFAMMPRLIERAGNSATGGSITAFYTILVEDDGVGDPVAEEARSLLDGHIVLSRSLAEAGRFPAIDPLASRSRVMNRVVSADHIVHADRVRAMLARYADIELLLKMGEYSHGSDPLADEAIHKREAIQSFLYRTLDEPLDWPTVGSELSALVA